jgi:predicted ATPase
VNEELLRGRYRILETVGRGGQGEVHRAIDVLHDRQVAVKVRRLPHGEPHDHVLMEARVLFALTPHKRLTVAREDHVIDDTYLLVMDWVDGPSAGQHLAGAPMTYEQAVDVLRDVASALDHLHAHDPPVVHGDVKPENIILSSDRGPVLVDFGLSAGSSDSTPGYQAPEVAEGVRTPAADVYALAATAHTLLEGSPPDDGTLPELAAVPESQRDRVLDALRTGLAYDPGRRPVSASDLVALIAPPTTPTNLSRPLTALIGRSDDLAQLDTLLPQSRLFTLTGPAGVGKTRLANAVAHAQLHRFPEGVSWADLAPVEDGAGIAHVVATALGATAPSPLEPIDQAKAAVGDGTVLLICDNAEHVLAECGRLASELLGACGGLVILVTSRETLGMLGEVVVDVRPLDVPDERARQWEMEDADAVRLFVERARPRFEPEADDYPTIASICRTVDGLPLAIEMAAARVSALGLAALEDGLRDRFALLRAGPGTPARHRSLEAAIEWSHELLSDAEKACFRRLSIFPATFGLHAVTAVCIDNEKPDEASAKIAHLVDCSLVAREGAQCRLLESVRVFAEGKLRAHDESGQTMDRLIMWLAAASDEERGWANAPPAPLEAYRARFNEDTVRFAVSECLAQGRHEEALRIMVPQGLRVISRTEELRKILGSVVATTPFDYRLLATVQNYVANREVNAGRHAAAMDLLEAAVLSSRIAEEPLGQVQSLVDLSRVASMLGDDDATVRYCDEALNVARSAGDDESLAEALNAKAVQEVNRRRFESAVELMEEANALFGERRLINPYVDVPLCYMYTVIGRVEDAARLVEKMIPYSDEKASLHQRQGLSVRWLLGRIARLRGEVEDAGKHLVYVLDRALESGSEAVFVLVALVEFARLADVKDQADDAVRLLAACDAELGRMGLPSDRMIDEFEMVVDGLRARFVADRFEALWAEGGRLQLDDAIALARAMSDPDGTPVVGAVERE